LASEIQHSYHFLDGGFRFDGKEIVAVNDQQVISCIDNLRQGDRPCKNIVIAGLFSSLNEEQEKHVAEIIKDRCPDASLTMSHQIGHFGLLDRENAAILNESLKLLASETILAFRHALNSLGLQCPFYLTQNDGTLISAERAIEFPVFTFASGPTNSMRGAAFLSGVPDAIVIDIGGTTTDVGMIQNKFPREASSQVKVRIRP
jgi:N-methylhydantoinase A/oxoprolinase/acetone carboxylase beta subunit